MAEKTFGQLLKAARVAARDTQFEAAKKLGITEPYYWRIESGRSKPGERVVARAAEVYGLSRDELFRSAGMEPVELASPQETDDLFRLIRERFNVPAPSTLTPEEIGQARAALVALAVKFGWRDGVEVEQAATTLSPNMSSTLLNRVLVETEAALGETPAPSGPFVRVLKTAVTRAIAAEAREEVEAIQRDYCKRWSQAIGAYFDRYARYVAMCVERGLPVFAPTTRSQGEPVLTDGPGDRSREEWEQWAERDMAELTVFSRDLPADQERQRANGDLIEGMEMEICVRTYQSGSSTLFRVNPVVHAMDRRSSEPDEQHPLGYRAYDFSDLEDDT